MNISKWRILEFSVNCASKNMAIDEAIFSLYNELKLNTIRLYGWEPSAVSIGRHQEVEKEVNIENLEKFNFDFVRRISGGGAVFHDSLGELTYSIVTNTKNLTSRTIEASYYELVKFIVSPITRLGINLDYNQIHCPSVFCHGKKISGNAQARNKDIILQHGTILIKMRPDIMYSVLKAHPGRTRESMIESVYQNIITISEVSKKNYTPESLGKYIFNYLIKKNSLKFTQGRLENEERNKMEELKSKKYESKEWLYLK